MPSWKQKRFNTPPFCCTKKFLRISVLKGLSAKAKALQVQGIGLEHDLVCCIVVAVQHGSVPRGASIQRVQGSLGQQGIRQGQRGVEEAG